MPQPINRDNLARLGIYEWIDGGAIGTPGADDIEAAVLFLRELRRLCQAPDSMSVRLATESCLSARDFFSQIEQRIDQLTSICKQYPALQFYLEGSLKPRYQAEVEMVQSGFDENGWDIAKPIEQTVRTLSPSDFGFHNALRCEDGRLRFIDFEYFGWDDPVRVVSDFVLHPGMQLNAKNRAIFLNLVIPEFTKDPNFKKRLCLLFPLVCIRWCLILLNEFLSRHWLRRVAANPLAEQSVVIRRQLERSIEMLTSLDARKGEIYSAI